MLEAKSISKQFAGIKALNNVNLRLDAGEVTAIVGENGAGKSTLMKILSGVYTQYEGDLFFEGKPIQFKDTKDAENHGIAIIHQELNLVPQLSITENIFLGREIVNSYGVLDKTKMKSIATSLLSSLNLKMDPTTLICEIKVGHQQIVEIAKALYTDAKVIIMDEPTSAISDKEIENLYQIVNNLKQQGKAIAYISHKFNELFTLADSYVVLKDGSSVDQGKMKDTTKEQLIEKMTGRELKFQSSNQKSIGSELILRVKNVTIPHATIKGKNVIHQISFDLHKGEIIGIYGLMGAGRTEIVECIFGLHAGHMIGAIEMNGKPLKLNTPSDAIEAGIALVPEDRKLQGLILKDSIRKNISLTILEKLIQWGVLKNGAEQIIADDFIQRLGIKTDSSDTEVGNLSGGNQQKTVLAKWLATQPQVLLLDEPTRGIDVNAKAEIYALMHSLAASGMGIIMVSSELPEILHMSHQVLVVCEGSITASLSSNEATEQSILQYAINNQSIPNELIQ